MCDDSLIELPRPLQLCRLLSLEWLIISTMCFIFLAHAFSCPFLDPRLTTHHSNIGVRFRKLIKLGSHTLRNRDATTWHWPIPQPHDRTFFYTKYNLKNLPTYQGNKVCGS